LGGQSDRDKNLRALFEALNTGISNLQSGIAEIVTDVRSRHFAKNFGTFASGLTSPGFLSSLGAIRASGFNVPATAPSVVDESHKASVFTRAKKRHEDSKTKP
jgi:hypothetical protein